MATLQEIIQREINPFDSVTFTTGNFWTEEKQSNVATVESIHQSAITQIQDTLQDVIRDNRTRSVLLTGDSGCGKSYLLSRLKKTLNDRAFFVYIEPCLVSDRIWRHTLRHTVDGLMHVPDGEKESQLLLWLKSLSAYKDGGFIKKILGEKNHFVRELRSIYPTGIYQPKDFFSVLYALVNPDLYFSACDWLRGNSISEEELKLLGVGNSSAIDTEETAKGIIANFGRISTDNKPIVLCFDQIEAGSKFADGSLDISPVFNVNTAFHNNHLKNFLVIVSIVQDKWRICQRTIPQSDLARISREIVLKQINLEQVKALWSDRLFFIHAQVNPPPTSPLAPLDERKLETKYPGGKANLRDSLNFGGILYKTLQDGKTDLDNAEAFEKLWQQEFIKTQAKITRLSQLSSPELLEILISVMKVLGIENIEPKLLSGKYSSYSFSYQSITNLQIGILWHEEANLRNFSYAMKACEKAIKANKNLSLCLIRSESIGTNKNKGYQIYQKIFNNSYNKHLKSNLESICYLKTYQKLVNDAISGDLNLNFEPIKLVELENLMREIKILEQCSLLQELISKTPIIKPIIKPLSAIKEFLFELVKQHHLLSQEILIKQSKKQFMDIEITEIEHCLQELIKEQKISIINPHAKPRERSICLIP